MNFALNAFTSARFARSPLYNPLTASLRFFAFMSDGALALPAVALRPIVALLIALLEALAPAPADAVPVLPFVPESDDLPPQ
jgi:hypothetical protein